MFAKRASLHRITRASIIAATGSRRRIFGSSGSGGCHSCFINQADLDFVLRKIKFSKARANGAALTEIRLDPETGEVLANANLFNDVGHHPGHETPYGDGEVEGGGGVTAAQ